MDNDDNLIPACLIDWHLTVLKLLECFMAMEGTVFEGDWGIFGIPEEEKARILYEFASFLKDKRLEKTPETPIAPAPNPMLWKRPYPTDSYEEGN